MKKTIYAILLSFVLGVSMTSVSVAADDKAAEKKEAKTEKKEAKIEKKEAKTDKKAAAKAKKETKKEVKKDDGTGDMDMGGMHH